jgi:hypothetical protein
MDSRSLSNSGTGEKAQEEMVEAPGAGYKFNSVVEKDLVVTDQ